MDNAATALVLEKKFKGLTPDEIISFASNEFGDKLMMTTAFGYSGIVLLSFVRKVLPELPIYFIDTRFHFEETMKLAEKINNEWDLNIQTISTRYSEQELQVKIGQKPYETDPDWCCHYRKVEPLLDIMSENTVWLNSTRQDQSVTRADTRSIEVDGRGHLKVSPLYNWSKDDCWTHIRKYDLPYNPLHDQYYPSIGCWPCTRPVDKGGSERSGRWAGFDKVECGLHLNGNHNRRIISSEKR